jgi:hypothetical protein
MIEVVLLAMLGVLAAAACTGAAVARTRMHRVLRLAGAIP